MKWFRRHIKTGSRLALFALAIQFALSFGHFHFDTARAAPEVQLQVNLGDAQRIAVDAASQSQQPSGKHDTDRPSNDPCAICTVMSMANQMLFATPALLLLPDALELLYLATDAELAHLSESWPGFQSRAPPVS
jgi:hypothetical protein